MRASPATVPDSEGAVNPREQALAQSKLEGNLLLSEIKLKQLKAERLKAADEKEALQREYNALLEEKQALEKDHLRAEHERLKVAKALIDIEVEGNAQTATLEAQVAELKSQLLALERDKRELAGEREAAEKLLEQRAAELRAAEGDKEDLTSELIAVRVTLEQQQRAADEIAAKQGALDLEVVSSVNTAEQRKAQLNEAERSLAQARKELEETRVRAAEEAKAAAGLRSQLLEVRSELGERVAAAESLQLEAKRAAVQKELQQTALLRERAELLQEKQQTEEVLADATKQAEARAAKDVAAEKKKCEALGAELIQANLKVQASERGREDLVTRMHELEAQLDAAERRTQTAHETQRSTLARLQHEAAAAIARARGVSGAGDLGEGLEEGAPADLQTMESLDDPVVPLLEAAKRLRHAQHEAMGAREVLLSQQLKELRGRHRELLAHRIVGPAAAAAALAADGDEVTWVDLNEEAHSLNVAHDSEAPLALLESSASAALRAALEEAAELRRQHETFNARIMEASEAYATQADEATKARALAMKEMAAEAPDSPEVKAARLWKSAAETVKQQGKESKLKQKELILHLQQLSMQKAELRKQQEHQATSHAELRRLRLENESLRAQLERGDGETPRDGGGVAGGPGGGLGRRYSSVVMTPGLQSPTMLDGRTALGDAVSAQWEGGGHEARAPRPHRSTRPLPRSLYPSGCRRPPNALALAPMPARTAPHRSHTPLPPPSRFSRTTTPRCSRRRTPHASCKCGCARPRRSARSSRPSARA